MKIKVFWYLFSIEILSFMNLFHICNTMKVLLWLLTFLSLSNKFNLLLTESILHSIYFIASKVSDLYASLRERNANVYIQRSRQLYKDEPMRERLWTMAINDLDIICLADRALHGKENVIAHMKDIDPTT